MRLPPWSDANKMARWLDEQLDLLFAKDAALARARRQQPYTDKEKELLFGDAGVAKEALEFGNVEPARRLLSLDHPLLVPLLNLPARRRGQRYAKPAALDLRKARLDIACMEVGRIRSLWRQHYGRRNRARRLGNAEAFAAARWNISEDAIVDALKRRQRLLVR